MIKEMSRVRKKEEKNDYSIWNDIFLYKHFWKFDCFAVWKTSKRQATMTYRSGVIIVFLSICSAVFSSKRTYEFFKRQF